MKDMRIDAAGHDALKFSGFYMTDSEDFAIAYDPQSGKIAIPSGTQVLGGIQASSSISICGMKIRMK